MNIAYELNPPKIVKDGRFDLAELNAGMQVMAERASQLARRVSGIHLTDSVLGIPRVSSVTAAGRIKSVVDKGVRLSCSLRVRDRNFTAVCQAVSDAILVGVDSMLMLMGDEPAGRPADMDLKPSAAARMLKDEGYDAMIKLDLSFPSRIKDRSSVAIQNKLDARPDSFVTQSISSLSDLGEIADLAKAHGIKIAACIMVPSDKNKQSAEMIGLDWSKYERNPADFVRQAGKIADRVLLTSPNSFRSGLELLRQLS